MTDMNELQELVQQLIGLDDEDAIRAFLERYLTQLLSEEAIAELDKLAAAATTEPQRQRLAERRHLLQTLRQMQAIAALPPVEQHFLAFMAVSNGQEMRNFVLRFGDQALDELAEFAATKQTEAEGEEAEAIQQRLDGLHQVRQQLQADYGDQLPFIRRLDGWIKTDTWTESERYLQEHATQLLTDAAEQALQQLLINNWTLAKKQVEHESTPE